MKIVDKRVKEENDSTTTYGNIVRYRNGSNYMFVRDAIRNKDYFLNLDTYELIDDTELVISDEEITEIIDSSDISLVIE